MEVGKEGSR